MIRFSLKKLPDQGNVYIFREKQTDLYKIGFTKNDPKNRILNLKSNGADCEIIHFSNTYRSMEKELHQYFKEENIIFKGMTEFFKLTKDQLSMAINTLIINEI